MMTNCALSLIVLAVLASIAATSATNWMGPTIGDATNSACYRKSHLTSNCPLGFETGGASTCWAQCPMAYPVECGMECIPQNDDCAIESITKIGAVASTALNAATMGLFGDIKRASQAVQLGVTCGIELVSLTRSLVSFVRAIQTKDPDTPVEVLLTMAYQADVVVVDLPVAAAKCLNIPVPEDAKKVNQIMTLVELIVREIVANGDSIIQNANKLLDLLSGSAAGESLSSLNSTSSKTLSDFIDSGSSCGWELKRLVDEATRAVIDLKTATPDASESNVRAEISKSPLVLNDIPTVTNNCMAELGDSEDAYATRDNLRKTFGIILDNLIETSSTGDSEDFSTVNFLRTVIDKELGVLAIFDPTGLAGLAAEFIQPICGPTEFIGEIDDGSLTDALGLATIDDAFKGSEGTWTKVGDGIVVITFVSTDEEDVTVNIISAGDKVDEVNVAAGEMVTWTSTVPELEGKTLYLDRWRPGFLGLPGTGGGSLLLWIPRSSSGGHLELTAKINVS